MSQKFDSLRSQVLYARATADDEVGDSADGIGWAGLYLRWEGAGGYIVSEDNQGFVSHYAYAADAEIEAAWGQACDSLEFSGDPDHDDYVVMENPRTSQFYSLVTGEGVMYDSLPEIMEDLQVNAALKAVRPNYWFLNSRGNFIPLAVVDPEQ